MPDDPAFDTVKPEQLLQRILEIATNENDLVLDSFLGSGTTAAVAHKMNRRYIGIEMGEHAETHCQPRLKKSSKANRAVFPTRSTGKAAGSIISVWARRFLMNTVRFILRCALPHWPHISGFVKPAYPWQSLLIRRCWAYITIPLITCSITAFSATAGRKVAMC